MQIDNDTLNGLKEEACKILGIDTLETRNSDSLDFHDTAVWTIIDVIKMAYAEGHQQGGLDSI